MLYQIPKHPLDRPLYTYTGAKTLSVNSAGTINYTHARTTHSTAF